MPLVRPDESVEISVDFIVTLKFQDVTRLLTKLEASSDPIDRQLFIAVYRSLSKTQRDAYAQSSESTSKLPLMSRVSRLPAENPNARNPAAQP